MLIIHWSYTLYYNYNMAHLQLAPGALHTYVSDSYVDGRVLHTIYNTLKVFNNFKAGYQVAWGRPTIVTQPTSTNPVTGGITVKVGYYAPGLHALSSQTILQLRMALSEVCQRPVVLIVTRLSGPYMDANVLAQYLARELKTKKFGRVINRMLGAIGTVSNATPITTWSEDNYSYGNGVQLPASLVGVQVSVHGRLSAEPARPRMTEQRIVVGSLTANDQQVLDTSSTTAINKKNVYTVKVMLTHRLLTLIDA